MSGWVKQSLLDSGTVMLWMRTSKITTAGLEVNILPLEVVYRTDLDALSIYMYMYTVSG